MTTIKAGSKCRTYQPSHPAEKVPYGWIVPKPHVIKPDGLVVGFADDEEEKPSSRIVDEEWEIRGSHIRRSLPCMGM